MTLPQWGLAKEERANIAMAKMREARRGKVR
jgi:hypothetical protein